MTEPEKSSESSQNFSFRKANQIIHKFHIVSGDVVLLKHGSSLANEVAMNRLADALGALNIDAIIAVVEDFDDLSVLNEVDMLKHGWMRVHKISSVLPRRKINGKDSP